MDTCSPSYQDTVTKEMGPLARFVEEVGEEAISCIKNLEASKRDISAYHFRMLRLLLTPAARRNLVPEMLRPGVKLAEVEAVAKRLAVYTWVSFHWSAENNLIHPDVGMHHPPLSQAVFMKAVIQAPDGILHPSTMIFLCYAVPVLLQ